MRKALIFITFLLVFCCSAFATAASAAIEGIYRSYVTRILFLSVSRLCGLMSQATAIRCSFSRTEPVAAS